LVGRPATALSFTGAEGRVRLGDSDWPARLVHGAHTPAPMTALEVVAVDGLVLLVRPSEMTQG
jgi:membrane protein implicated in regulation of membrane protease activity